MIHNNDDDINFLSKEELNELFKEVVEIPADDMIAFDCAITCTTAPSGK